MHSSQYIPLKLWEPKCIRRLLKDKPTYGHLSDKGILWIIETLLRKQHLKRLLKSLNLEKNLIENPTEMGKKEARKICDKQCR